MHINTKFKYLPRNVLVPALSCVITTLADNVTDYADLCLRHAGSFNIVIFAIDSQLFGESEDART
jgi:ascorbate-specific PTS system EIIC-type component UlaA